MRPEPLNEEEASALELKEALRCVAAREKYIRSTTSPRTLNANESMNIAQTTIDDIFGTELPRRSETIQN
ncbi:hypothetical protein M422DRAFT_273803 [Sphaerobolus stellatus SS14]|uniref:Uncharacterized protein n=1 Tax=Sphaerobolus stellatus (strain SS14) TaxID=990650 RepID=A0A0C9UJ33_SPHS4|nr:hypothetical protein M422DRAFT_273803 [Sphaerobolus stellatus SS14]